MVTAYYCRDPDTGFLHPANSTWQSTTFCGNYTCKLRKRIKNDTTPIRSINITNVNVTQSKTRSTLFDNVKNEDDSVVIIPNDSTLSSDNADLSFLKSLLPSGQIDLSKLNLQERLIHNQPYGSHETGDRFLTDKEIQAISELLHNVKKSDLEAIVDIYSLAQDIYKEMDKMTSDDILEETMKFVNTPDKPDNKKASYWYEPAVHNKGDLEHQGSNIVSSTAAPETRNPNSYFGGTLQEKDFGKLPYYYPLSNFQRQSSYVRPTYIPQAPKSVPEVPKPPCNTPTNKLPPVVVPQSAYNQPPNPYNYINTPQNYRGVMKKPFTVENQKSVLPSSLLPYPFSYVQHFNMSNYPFNNYYENNAWGRFDVNTNNNQKSFYKAHISQIPSVHIRAKNNKLNKESDLGTEGQMQKENGNLLSNLLENAKALTQSRAEWKTDPIPPHVLDEIRAHIDEKINFMKPFSLRKKVKLERVGKLVKLDELHREKRNIIEEETIETDEEEMEVYIEKTT